MNVEGKRINTLGGLPPHQFTDRHPTALRMEMIDGKPTHLPMFGCSTIPYADWDESHAAILPFVSCYTSKKSFEELCKTEAQTKKDIKPRKSRHFERQDIDQSPKASTYNIECRIHDDFTSPQAARRRLFAEENVSMNTFQDSSKLETIEEEPVTQSKPKRSRHRRCNNVDFTGIVCRLQQLDEL